MNWDAIAAKFERVRTGDTDLQKKIRGLRRRLTLLLAVVGPGLITSNVDNDAGGISVYTQAGAQYGYALLWSLIPMTIALYVTEEMGGRMAVATGQGVVALIRGEFAFRVPLAADGPGRNHDCSVALLLPSGRIRGKEGRSTPVPAGARRRAHRQHQLHGDRFFYHRLHGGHALYLGAPRHHRCRAGGAGADSACWQRRGDSVRFRTAQRVPLCRIHFAAFHSARDLRGAGI